MPRRRLDNRRSRPMSFRIPFATTCGLATGLLAAWAGSAFSDEPATEKTVAARPFPKVDRFGDPLPSGALFRLGTERFRHRYVSRLVYSSDGKILASMTGARLPEQQYAVLWDTTTG